MLVVAAALSDGEGRWLMHRRPVGKEHAGLWEFPGGKVEPGETVRQALAREMFEESALKLDIDAMREAGFAASDAAVDGRGIVLLLYTCSRWSGSITAKEGGEFKWHRPAEIARLPKPPLDVELARQLFEK
ncbi:mutator mutT protein, hypothetical [Erythrobacter litoralis HTCC2594]|uniref:8-oxo-dGTP diphosphatase n=1 Tax=Erythrobacter litoralis (strain HTCC2594) TaxID=314225 RepID=Q2NB47_ERYLH|nr:mutator mutT protein, hypothetical [Erythrobacter litoralis HTCC2594]